VRRPSRVAVLAACTLALSGCHRATVPTPGGSGPDARAAAAGGPSAELVALGDSIFKSINCARCHGATGEGSETGPTLRTGPWLQADGSLPSIVQVITSGVPVTSLKTPGLTRGMAARGGPANLSDDQVRAVAAYVFTISRGKR
jgi:mono/diheme cytochrome c family protein